MVGKSTNIQQRQYKVCVLIIFILVEIPKQFFNWSVICLFKCLD